MAIGSDLQSYIRDRALAAHFLKMDPKAAAEYAGCEVSQIHRYWVEHGLEPRMPGERIKDTPLEDLILTAHELGFGAARTSEFMGTSYDAVRKTWQRYELGHAEHKPREETETDRPWGDGKKRLRIKLGITQPVMQTVRELNDAQLGNLCKLYKTGVRPSTAIEQLKIPSKGRDAVLKVWHALDRFYATPFAFLINDGPKDELDTTNRTQMKELLGELGVKTNHSPTFGRILRDVVELGIYEEDISGPEPVYISTGLKPEDLLRNLLRSAD